jgi:hypothetical protein
VNGFTADPDRLRAHAQQVDALAERTRTAAEAGASLDRGAYGLLGQGVAAAVALASGLVVDTVAEQAVTLGGVGNGLRADAAGYADVERRHVARFGEIR